MSAKPPVHAPSAHSHSGVGYTHSHPVSANSDSRLLAATLGLFVSFIAFEVTMAFIGHSLALLADAGHMLADTGGLAASLMAIRLARRPAGGRWTYGLRRAEVLSAQANGITLVVVSALVGFEAVRRLAHPARTTGGILLGVALTGVAINLLATWLLAKADRGAINIKGAFAHVVTDLYAFIGTVIAGIVIITTGYHRADSIASLVVVAIMLRTAAALLGETGRILLEAAPPGLEPDRVSAAILTTPGVQSVHDVHVWLVTSGFPALSAHVLVQPPEDCHAVRRDIERTLLDDFGLDHTTLQVDHAGDEIIPLGPTVTRR